MQSRASYQFDSFVLNLADHTLVRDSAERIHLEPKTFHVLVALVENHGRLISREELINEVWGVGHEMSVNNLDRRISDLRRSLGDDKTQPRFIRTEPRLGYCFIAPVTTLTRGAEISASNDARPRARGRTDKRLREEPRPDDAPALQAQSSVGTKTKAVRILWRYPLMMIAVVFLAAACALLIRQFVIGEPEERSQVRSLSDDTEVRRVVRESQMFETLEIYTDPAAYNRGQLDRYWLTTEQGGKEPAKIERSVARLLERGWRYGDESRVEIFDFRYVRIYSPRDYAEAGTSERWFVPTVHARDSSRVENRNVYLGVYDVDYVLRKVNGRWLVEETSTPRARPSPSPSAGS